MAFPELLLPFACGFEEAAGWVEEVVLTASDPLIAAADMASGRVVEVRWCSRGCRRGGGGAVVNALSAAQAAVSSESSSLRTASASTVRFFACKKRPKRRSFLWRLRSINGGGEEENGGVGGGVSGRGMGACMCRSEVVVLPDPQRALAGGNRRPLKLGLQLCREGNILYHIYLMED